MSVCRYCGLPVRLNVMTAIGNGWRHVGLESHSQKWCPDEGDMGRLGTKATPVPDGCLMVTGERVGFVAHKTDLMSDKGVC